MFNENSDYSDDNDNDFVGEPKESKTEDKMDPKVCYDYSRLWSEECSS